jgi:hypothetical protein
MRGMESSFRFVSIDVPDGPQVLLRLRVTQCPWMHVGVKDA